MGPGWRQGADGLFRLVQDFTEKIFKEPVCISLGGFECGSLTKGNTIAPICLIMALKLRFLGFIFFKYGQLRKGTREKLRGK